VFGLPGGPLGHRREALDQSRPSDDRSSYGGGCRSRARRDES
jgi:hypothetical protein